MKRASSGLWMKSARRSDKFPPHWEVQEVALQLGNALRRRDDDATTVTSASVVAAFTGKPAMNMNRRRLDDSFNFALVAVSAVLALGLQVSTSMGYALDRGSAQARADERARDLRVALAVAEAASRAARAREIQVAYGRP